MLKRCGFCRSEYFTRWRNEPIELCPSCRTHAIVCASCAALMHAPPDPEQLRLFPGLLERPPSRLEAPTVEERYWSLRAKASQSMRRRYPYC